MDALRQDFGYALRTLRQHPAFALTAILTLALGIGASTAIFSVVNAVLLRPLPYQEAERLVLVWGEMRARDVHDFPFPPPDFQDLRDQTTAFQELAAISPGRAPLGGADGAPPERVISTGVTPNLFRMLGHRVALGRDFRDEDAAPPPPPPGGDAQPNVQGAPPPQLPAIVILNHGFSQRRFGGDASVVGKMIDVGNQRAEIVGVLAPGFELLFPPETNVDPVADMYVAMRIDYENASRLNVFMRVIGKLKPGVPVTAAQEQAERVAADLRERFPIKKTSDLHFVVEPMHDDLVAEVRPVIVFLMGAVGFVLLIACANVANLLLVRGAGRARELAVRAALGAGRRRIVLQLVVESALLALAGAALGLLLAVAGVRLLLDLAPATIPRLDQVTVNGTVLLFTLGVAVATALLFGLPYGIRAGAMRLASTLKDGQRGSGTEGMRARRALVVSQLALTLAILAAAGLLLTTVRRLQTMDAGLDPRGVLSAQVALPASRYEPLDKRRAFQDELLARVRALPGVSGAAATSNLPLSGSESGGTIRVVGEPDRPGLDEKEVRSSRATPDYFATLRMPMRRGRTFLPEERGTDSTGVAVINETLARLYFGDRDPIGRQIASGSDESGPRFTVVGVVGDARQSLLDSPIRPEMFTSAQRNPGGGFALVVRTTGDPAALAAPIRAVVRELDPELALARVQPLERYWATSIAARRFNALLLGIFALVALVLAVVGIYGVMAYAVAARQREVGIRLAVGAQPGQVVRLVLRDALGMTIVGLTLGLALTLAISRLLTALLFDVSATDPLLLAAATALLGLVGLAAGVIPSRRAAGVDPLVALRAE